jgi:hypothetical protein
MTEGAEWTDTDLALIQSLDAAGAPIGEIAERLGRSAEEVERHIAVVRLRVGAVPEPGDD